MLFFTSEGHLVTFHSYAALYRPRHYAFMRRTCLAVKYIPLCHLCVCPLVIRPHKMGSAFVFATVDGLIARAFLVLPASLGPSRLCEGQTRPTLPEAHEMDPLWCICQLRLWISSSLISFSGVGGRWVAPLYQFLLIFASFMWSLFSSALSTYRPLLTSFLVDWSSTSSHFLLFLTFFPSFILCERHIFFSLCVLPTSVLFFLFFLCVQRKDISEAMTGVTDQGQQVLHGANG